MDAAEQAVIATAKTPAQLLQSVREIRLEARRHKRAAQSSRRKAKRLMERAAEHEDMLNSLGIKIDTDLQEVKADDETRP